MLIQAHKALINILIIKTGVESEIRLIPPARMAVSS